MTEQNQMRHGKKKRTFTQVDNEIVNNSALSYQAKGMLLYLLSKPDGWKFYEDDLVKRSANGKTSVRSTIKELLDSGYLIRGERFRDEKGHLKGYSYIVEPYLLDDYDGKSYITFSKVGKSKVGNSNLGNPYVGKSQRSNTKGLSNTNPLSNTEKDNNIKGKNQSSLSSQIFNLIEQNNIAALTEYTSTEIGYMINDTSEELVLRAIQIAIDNNARNLNYIKSIIRSWKAKGYKTVAQVENAEQQRKNQPSQEGANYMKETYGDLPF